MDKKERLFYTFLGTFVLWVCAVVFYLIPQVLLKPETLDPALQMITGIGIGSITQAYLVLITLAWQFWFRKKSPEDTK